VWFNEERDEWLQMRRTAMKVAPVSTTTDVNNRRAVNEVSLERDERQRQQQQELQELLTDDTDTVTDTPV